MISIIKWNYAILIAGWIFKTSSNCTTILTNAFIPKYNKSPRQYPTFKITVKYSISTSLNLTKSKNQLSRPERKALERKNKSAKNNKKHEQKSGGNRAQSNNQDLNENLHSNNISRLTSKSTADDVIKAIKRAQNRHDEHDLRIIAKFLIHDVGMNYGYGFRGSLLARLTVAALHMSNHEISSQAIQLRRTEYRSSMLPMESAAIIRGLLRTHNVTDALNVWHDELHLPLEVRYYYT